MAFFVFVNYSILLYLLKEQTNSNRIFSREKKSLFFKDSLHKSSNKNQNRKICIFKG